MSATRLPRKAGGTAARNVSMPGRTTTAPEFADGDGTPRSGVAIQPRRTSAAASDDAWLRPASMSESSCAVWLIEKAVYPPPPEILEFVQNLICESPHRRPEDGHGEPDQSRESSLAGPSAPDPSGPD